MTTQFALFWINKNMNLSEYTPDKLSKAIPTLTKYVLDNMDLPIIKSDWSIFCANNEKIKDIEQTFWLEDKDTINKEIHYSTEYSNVRRLLKSYKNILIFAGAGMSADSGLQVFREKKKTLFSPDLSNGQQIRDLFSSHKPHLGYKKLLNFCNDKDYYVMTSNIDGYFSRSGFKENKIVEIHGNIFYTQCCDKIYSHKTNICPLCDLKTRENVLSFGDRNWINRTENIEKNMDKWIQNKIEINENILIIEIGAGIHIPSIRDYSEILLTKYKKQLGLIRINPEYWDVPEKLLKYPDICRVPMKSIDFFNCFL